jgi:protein-L-isoaspartate(D-aspartate) O-methyltransferase
VKDRRAAVAGMLLRLRAIGLPHHLMEAFEQVPRQNFVPVMHLFESYERGQLPIECGQTMTSADQVARTLRELDVKAGQRVLELGAGSGYQAALLGRLAKRVVTLERFRTLADKAAIRLQALEIANVTVTVADGSEGVPGQVFDRILANFAFSELPRGFVDQIASGGMMIAPIGDPGQPQMLRKFVKVGSRFESGDLFAVRMQPPIPGVSRAI